MKSISFPNYANKTSRNRETLLEVPCMYNSNFNIIYIFLFFCFLIISCWSLCFLKSLISKCLPVSAPIAFRADEWCNDTDKSEHHYNTLTLGLQDKTCKVSSDKACCCGWDVIGWRSLQEEIHVTMRHQVVQLMVREYNTEGSGLSAVNSASTVTDSLTKILSTDQISWYFF